MAIFPDRANLSALGHSFFTDRLREQGEQVGAQVGIGNPIGIVFLLVVGFITLISARIFTLDRALAASTFIGAVMSFFLVKLGWLSSGIFYIMLIALSISILMVLANREG